MADQLTLDDVKSLGTILGVWAHPDDESFMMAGLIASAIQNGQKIICVTATKGELGVQDESRWPAATLGDTRAAELAAAFKLLGISHHHWLDYKDGSCHEVIDDEAITRICELIDNYRPDTVITFAPDGGTGHLDHVAVSRWAREAILRCKYDTKLFYAVDLKEQYESYFKELDEKFDIYFNLDDPHQVKMKECDILLDLGPELADLKCQALMAMPSQTEAMFSTVGKAKMCQALSYEGFVSADRVREWGRPRPPAG